jgi:predicted ATPase/signal transduction histidine kinase
MPLMQRAGYTFHETLHEGSRSTLIRATRLEDGRPVIFKLPGGDYLGRHRTLEIQREYAICCRVRSDLTIQALGLESLGDRLALVLEDFGGQPLRSLADRQGSVDVKKFLDLAIRVTASLGHIHSRGVIHKDIKPQNILYNPDTRVLKVADFSISATLSLETATPESPTHLVGTLAYMAPEQTGRMNRSVDYRADFYALGATFFELLTGRRVFPYDSPLELLHAHIAQVPPSPRDLVAEVPEQIAAIVLKLLAKDPEARYQGAWGLNADLEECQRQLQEKGSIGRFPLGTSDRSRRFRLPQGLYGRASDLSLLMEAHARTTAGRCELLLVAGSAGIGKSSLVNELHRVIAARQGSLAVGKCDQLNRSIPFDAIQQALLPLIHQTLADGETRTAAMRERLQAVLGGNVSVLVEAVPEMRTLLGEQPPPMPLPPSESSNRLNLVLTRTIQAFATVDRPLVIFVDDLQWADSATLALLQALTRDPDSHHLLLVGAYRDAEVPASHPLAVTLSELRTQGLPLTELHLTPLGPEEVTRMIQEATDATIDRANELGRLIHARAGGNPFSVKEFLRVLHEQELLRTSPQTGRWEWDMAQIEAREIPDDVAILMANELRGLPPATIELVKIAACLGVAFNFQDLSVACATTPTETARVVWSVIERGFVLPLSKDYLLLDQNGGGTVPADLEVPLRFLHDRVRHAAYSLIPEGERAEWHLKVGLRLFEEARASGTLEERLFTILPHLGHAPERIGPAALRSELMALYMKAGRRAKASGAYRTASELFRAGTALLPETAWEIDHERAFVLHMELAESRFLAGEFAVATQGFTTLLTHARTDTQRSGVLAMQATLASLNSQHAEALRIGLEGLKLFGVELPLSPDGAALGAELGEVAARLGGRSAMELLELPRMSDPRAESSINLLASIAASAYQDNQSLFALLVLRMVRLSLEYGNSRLSPFGYVIYGVLLATALDEPHRGRQFGQLAVDLAARFQEHVLHARVRYLRAGLIDFWTQNARAGLVELREAYKGLAESGDWIYAGHCLAVLLWRRWAAGDPLQEIQEDSHRTIEFLKVSKDPDTIFYVMSVQQTLLMMRGIDEDVSKRFPETSAKASQAYLHLCATEQHYLFRQPEQALRRAQEAVPYISYCAGLVLVALHAFYHALSAAEVYRSAGPEQKEKLAAEMEQQLAYLEKIAGRSPESFSPHHLLVSAEVAYAKGQIPQAISAYELAIIAARAQGFLNVEALACELACRFHLKVGRRPLASSYLLDALYAYDRWGATHKSNLLAEEQASLLRSLGSAFRQWDERSKRAGLQSVASDKKSGDSTGSSTSESLTESLDMSSVMKASQAISSEILFPQLVASLIHIAQESAGAQRAVLVLKRDQEYFVEAATDASPEGAGPVAPHRLRESQVLCQAIAQQALRTGQPVHLDDASAEESYREDGYIARGGVRSVLCAPILHRRQIVGMFYLENNLISGAFNASRLQVLGMLSAQAAISLENAALYHKLEEYSHTLERRVAERTAELDHKNKQLERTLETIKAMQAQIITQEKLASLGALTAGIAHELKNPLNFVTNFAALSLELVQELRESVREDRLLAPRQRQGLEKLVDALELNMRKTDEYGQRATGIINGMLQHARGEQGERMPIQINKLIHESVLLVRHGLDSNPARRDVVIETEFDDTVPELLLVPGDIQRVIINLLDNACYAASEQALKRGAAGQARVTVRTKWHEGAVEVRVRDNGNGIPPAIREKIFTPFFTTKPPSHGTGLGLSICYDIVVVTQGGKLWVESEEGQYAEFVAVLPGTLASQGMA